MMVDHGAAVRGRVTSHRGQNLLANVSPATSAVSLGRSGHGEQTTLSIIMIARVEVVSKKRIDVVC